MSCHMQDTLCNHPHRHKHSSKDNCSRMLAVGWIDSLYCTCKERNNICQPWPPLIPELTVRLARMTKTHTCDVVGCGVVGSGVVGSGVVGSGVVGSGVVGKGVVGKGVVGKGVVGSGVVGSGVVGAGVVVTLHIRLGPLEQSPLNKAP